MSDAGTTGVHLDEGGARDRLLAGVPAARHRVGLAGISTAVLVAGDGPPLVMLHGPGEFAERWTRVIPGLAANHRVIAPDLPGHGGSTDGTGPLDTDRVFDWLDALIDEMCPTPPVLVGHILGGALAARYAASRPDRLAGIVLVDSLGLAKFRPQPRFALSLIGFMARPSDRSHHRFMGQCLADREAVSEAMGDRWDALREYSLDRARDDSVKTAMKFFMSELGVPKIDEQELADLSVPVTLIWGRLDRANKVRVGVAASERFGWPLHIIEGAADDPPMERPEEFVTAVLASC
jgi:pimeloyl-ACP methyl ester carboxylesterase